MNTFGLGLVLNFTDNASAGMNRVSQTFNQMNGLANQLVDSSDHAALAIMSLSATGMSLTMVGDQLSDVGSSIVGLFTTISKSVIDVGGQMQGFRMQLRALYGEDSYEQKLQDIKSYAQSSVFEVKSLMSAVTVMKAVGIEAMEDITTSSGKHTQKLLDYASDIAAMFPNMRNAYGTGVEAAMGAMKEYIAEGNAMSLKRGAGLDITGLLGEEKGATIEERTRQIADLVEQLGIAGYTASLVGTPTQQLSKIQDTLFNIMSDISDSGVYEKYTQLLTKAATWVDNLSKNTERYNAIVSIVGDTITAVLTPLESLLDYAIKIADAILDWTVEHPKLAKGILITVAAIGALLLVGGQILKFSGSIFMITSAFMQMSTLASSGVSIFNVFGRSIGIVVSKFIPFLAIAGLAYLVWSKNLFGIRDVVKQVFGELSTIWSLTTDAFSDNTLSEENYLKARDLGILPFIEALLDMKYLFGLFADGFKAGFDKVFDTIDKFAGKMTPVTGALHDITGKVGEFLKVIFNVKDDSDVWTKIGEAIGVVVGALAVVLPIIIGVTKAFSLISAVASFFTSPLGLVVLAIVAVIGAIVALKYAWDKNLGGIQEKAKVVFENILGFYNKYLAPFIDRVVTFVGTIITIVKNLWDSWLKPIFIQIGGFLSRIWTEVLSPFLQKLGSYMGSVVRFVWMIINAVLILWNNVLAPIVNWLVTVLAPIVNGVVQIILGAIEWVYTTITDIVGGILTILGGVLDFITGIFTGDWELAWQGICDIFGGIWETLVGIVTGVVNGIILVINTLISTLYSVLASVVNGIGGLIEGAADFLGFEDVSLSIPETAPQIPYLEHGGKVTEAVTAVIGEGKDDEVVLPLNNQVFSEIARGINNNRPVSAQPVQNDYSVTFSAGSIVIQLANATDAELEKAAEKLMKIIERKQQLKAMAVRA